MTYSNPIRKGDFADPFVLKYCGEYWAYCTDFWSDGRCFGILHSTDLIHWEALAGAMLPLAGNFTHYWAPEVTYNNGKFYLYYSVGDGEIMQTRVAVSTNPAGPFEDSGTELIKTSFAIDSHVFRDDDGKSYLFYATDFLDHTHIGTGIVRDQMLSPFELAGKPQPVVRAAYDWQVYDPERISKGGVRWHTVEGPFVLKHKNRYYITFSGGNYHNASYGTSYALTDNIEKPHEWRQVADGERILPILQSVPNEIIGPGHNSIIRGPDNRQLYCVYHQWSADGKARELTINPLEWVGERMVIIGGRSNSPQLTPTRPTIQGFDRELWQTEGEQYNGSPYGSSWVFDDTTMTQTAAVGAMVATYLPKIEGAFRLEVSLKVNNVCSPDAYRGLRLTFDDNTSMAFSFLAGNREIMIQGHNLRPQILKLPDHFDSSVYHLLGLDLDGTQLELRIDDNLVVWRHQLKKASANVQIGLDTQHSSVTFAGLNIAVGWQDLFVEPLLNNWEGQLEHWQIQEQELVCHSEEPQMVTKGHLLKDYELVINAKGQYGFYPALDADNNGILLSLTANEAGGWQLTGAQDEVTLALPAHFQSDEYQQFRFRKIGGRLSIQWESYPLGGIEVPDRPSKIGLNGNNKAAFEMVRVTAIA